MADRNQERTARATMAKQAYLRQHISAADYEDFGEFCEENVGNTVIESWSLEFVIQLVDQFRRKQAEKKEAEKRQPQEQRTFHIYQTGTANEMKELSEQIKQEAVKQPPHSARSTSKPKEESALEVLDSIFKDQKQVQFGSNKYDKAMFQSRHFWELGAAEQKQKESEKQSPSFAKNNKPIQPAQFATNRIEPENFEKIFQTGLKLPEIKKDAIEGSPKTKKTGQDHFNGISNKQPPKQSPKLNESTSNQQAYILSNKRNDIKLLSVKKLNSSKIPYDGEIIFPQPFKEFVSCFKSFERHALSVKNLTVSITDHEIINRSFFSSDYVMYHVKVSPANIVCKRNLEDFQKLRRNIESVYPGIRLPYLQKVGLFGSQTNAQIIQKQKRYLTFFLEDLMSHNETKNFRILEDFLTLKDHKQMKRKFQEYDKLTKIKAIQELCLLEGAVKVEISEPTRQYNEHVQAFNNKIQNYWGNQERIFAQIHELHQRISSLYGELAEAITNITKEINEFNRKVTLNEVQSLDDAFQSLFRYTNQHIALHDKQSQIMRNVFLVRTRYQRENMNTLDALSATRSDLTKSYLKHRETQKQTDNLEYLSERLKEFKTGITEDSRNLTVLKYQCGYINNLMMTEAHHYYTVLAQKVEKAVATATSVKREAVMRALDL